MPLIFLDTHDTANQKIARTRRHSAYWLIAVALLAISVAALSTHTARDYEKATALLLATRNPDSRWLQLTAGRVEEKLVSIPGSSGPIRCRLYSPALSGAPGLVLAHGVHRLGIDEPRLMDLARAFAGRGIVVMTPELIGLKNYRIDSSSINAIGDAARALHQQLGAPVGVMGLSFAGGLALMAAADARYQSDISSVIALGAYDDLARVTRFLATNEIELPDGKTGRIPAEQYGALVLVYAHIEDFFPPQDFAGTREAIRLWLWEQYDAARTQENSVSSASRQTLETLFRHEMDKLQPPLMASIQLHAAQMQRVSPRGHLGGVRAQVFLLHGADDAVIPSSETLWLARDVPANHLAASLITPVISHVDTNYAPGFRSQWRLISFMAHVFHQLEAEQAAH